MSTQTTPPTSRRNAPATPISYDEFLEWADEDTRAEWVDGEILMMSPASRRHQEIIEFLVKTLGIYVERRALGTLVTAPFQMKLESGREPDLVFVRNEHLDRLRETYLDGPADLAVEIVSPESAGRDRGDKFYEYAEGGVPEYWLIDPQGEWAEFYRLDGERYRPAFSGEEGRYESETVDDFWLEVGWLWQQPMPQSLDVLRDYELV